jgi:hypothetical protein
MRGKSDYPTVCFGLQANFILLDERRNVRLGEHGGKAEKELECAE